MLPEGGLACAGYQDGIEPAEGEGVGEQGGVGDGEGSEGKGDVAFGVGGEVVEHGRGEAVAQGEEAKEEFDGAAGAAEVAVRALGGEDGGGVERVPKTSRRAAASARSLATVPVPWLLMSRGDRC